MKVCIIMGSPRVNGNTASLLVPFQKELERLGCACTYFRLYERNLKPCTGCRCCQRDWSLFGCVQKDDLEELIPSILDCDLLVFATPIYSWYCTPPMKVLLDRLVYGMNKYYGTRRGPALWAGKSVALVTTCGYRPEKGADLWESGVKRYCKHAQLNYLGMLAERHMGYQTIFMDEEKRIRAKKFAAMLYANMSQDKMTSDQEGKEE